MKKSERLQLLSDEYRMLQGFYEDIDHRCLLIKNWGITVGLAALGAGFLYSGWLYLAAFLASLMFWYLDAYWRGLSYFFVQRIRQIESGMQDDSWEEMAPLQVYSVWEAEFSKVGSQKFRYLFRGITVFPHAAIAITGLILFVMALYGVNLLG